MVLDNKSNSKNKNNQRTTLARPSLSVVSKAKGRPSKGANAKANAKAKADAKAKAKAVTHVAAAAETVPKAKSAKPSAKTTSDVAGTKDEIALVEKSRLKFGKGIKFAKRLCYAMLLKRPADAPRPAFKKDMKPVHHHGGRIHWNTSQNNYRVCKRAPTRSRRRSK